jgi:hypothetical protein
VKATSPSRKDFPLEARDISIVTQVAFKAAVELNPTFNSTSDDSIAQFESDFSYLTDSLLTAIRTGVGVSAAPVAQAAAPVEQLLAQELGATPLTIEVITTKDGNGQQGPFPDWFIKAASDKGVTKVFDNRHKLSENPKLPWFKSSDGNNAFWPPRGK